MKNILIIICAIFLLCESAFSFSIFPSENLYPINDKNGGGYINKDGILVLEQKYKFAGRFNGHFAIVEGQNSKKGIIDKTGKIIINIEYDDLDKLSENFVIYKENNKYGYIDILKNKKSQVVFDKMKPFKEGLAAVCVNGKWGFINKKGEYVIKPKYYNVSNFNEGLSSVSYSYHTTAGYINKKGKMVITFKDNNLEPKEFNKSLAPIINGDDKSCSYINKRGKIIIDSNKLYPINIYCGNFYEGLNVFYIDNIPKEITTGYIDKRGRIKYSMFFSIPESFSEGEFSVFDNFSSNMAQVTMDYKNGYINKKFKMVIPPIYEFARNFEGDLAYVKFENKEGYINKRGQWVWTKEREGM